jgi:recombination protein RecR
MQASPPRFRKRSKSERAFSEIGPGQGRIELRPLDGEIAGEYPRRSNNLADTPRGFSLARTPPSRPNAVMGALENLQQHLKQLPGVGYRSAERIALYLVVEKPEQLPVLVAALEEAGRGLRRCARCGNLTEGELCAICSDLKRNQRAVCVVERVPDLVALERSGAWRGAYHVLHGRLSPLHGTGPADLNLPSLFRRVEAGEVDELVLAAANDVEGEATCHYLAEHLPAGSPVKISRIGFGLPSGAGVVYADSVTLKSALEGRRAYGRD